MKNNQLKAFVAVAEQGTIRAAARLLSLSQTAVTKSLRELELDLQVTLLPRSPHGVRLTDAGLELLRRAKLILTETEEARAAIQNLRGQGAHRVAVAMTPAFSMLCLPDTLQRFRTRFPNARLSIRDAFLSQLLPMLREGAIDVAITAVLPEVLGADLAFEPVGRLAIALAGRPGRFGPGPHRLADLSDAAWLLDDSRVGISEAIRQWLLRHQVPMPRHVIECPSSMAAFILSTQTDAIAPVPKAALSLPWLAPLSQEIILDEPLPTVPIGIVVRKDSRLDAAATWFVESARLSLRSIVTSSTA
ncbi:LysR family transcriptional regulator [Variovorax sp. YR216]|uniref:LysR family transcriptional regulator n=1 Tax=Variovorax sp. YR216 TaxID=1882828 RepID=UPI0008990896|nr:LysR substrate-binding domain-containing protein [Variovorax sp. YR216]SEB06312.1 transcriptional regulator, LysR family [Variovorax sp. YR216]